MSSLTWLRMAWIFKDVEGKGGGRSIPFSVATPASCWCALLKPICFLSAFVYMCVCAFDRYSGFGLKSSFILHVCVPAVPLCITLAVYIFHPHMYLLFSPSLFMYDFFVASLCAMCCALSMIFTHGAGNYIFTLFDDFSGNVPLLIIAFFECIAVSYFYGLDRYKQLN